MSVLSKVLLIAGSASAVSVSKSDAQVHHHHHKHHHGKHHHHHHKHHHINEDEEDEKPQHVQLSEQEPAAEEAKAEEPAAEEAAAAEEPAAEEAAADAAPAEAAAEAPAADAAAEPVPTAEANAEAAKEAEKKAEEKKEVAEVLEAEKPQAVDIFAKTKKIDLEGKGINKEIQTLDSTPDFVPVPENDENTHSLRVCNAYPSSMPFHVFRNGDKLTNAPLPYTACADFKGIDLLAGDQIRFHQPPVKKTSPAIFTVADLPDDSTMLALVIMRHDTETTAASFQSHVFRTTKDSPTGKGEAQVAVIDALAEPKRLISLHGKYSTLGTEVFIQDSTSEKHWWGEQAEGEHKSRKELLKLNSVVPVNSGSFTVSMSVPVKQEGLIQKHAEPHLLNEKPVMLNGDHGAVLASKTTEMKKQGPTSIEVASEPLIALHEENYVIIRTGVAGSKTYPQNLVVFPLSEPKKNSASVATLSGFAVIVSLMAMFAH